MITDAILSLLTSMITWALGVLPTVPVPSWLDPTDSVFATAFRYADSMSKWFPTALVMAVLGTLMLIKLTGFSIKIVRIVASFLSGGGGGAA